MMGASACAASRRQSPCEHHDPALAPLLVVQSAARSIAFYLDAFGAREIARYLDKARTTVSHADLTIASRHRDGVVVASLVNTTCVAFVPATYSATRYPSRTRSIPVSKLSPVPSNTGEMATCT